MDAKSATPSQIAMMSILNMHFITTTCRYFINTIILFTSYFRLVFLKIHSLRLSNVRSVSILTSFHNQAFKVKDYLNNSTVIKQISTENNSGSQHIITTHSCVFESFVDTRNSNINRVRCFSDRSHEVNEIVNFQNFVNCQSVKSNIFTDILSKSYKMPSTKIASKNCFQEMCNTDHNQVSMNDQHPHTGEVCSLLWKESSYSFNEHYNNESDMEVNQVEESHYFDKENETCKNEKLPNSLNFEESDVKSNEPYINIDSDSDFEIEFVDDIIPSCRESQSNSHGIYSHKVHSVIFSVNENESEESGDETDSDFEIEFDDNSNPSCSENESEVSGEDSEESDDTDSDFEVEFDNTSSSCDKSQLNSEVTCSNSIHSLFVSVKEDEETDDENWSDESQEENVYARTRGLLLDINVNEFNPAFSSEFAIPKKVKPACSEKEKPQSEKVKAANERWNAIVEEWGNVKAPYSSKFRADETSIQVNFCEEALSTVYEIPYEDRVNIEFLNKCHERCRDSFRKKERASSDFRF